VVVPQGEKLWMSRVPDSEHMKTKELEKGSYNFFNPTKWAVERRDEYVLHYIHMEDVPNPARRGRRHRTSPPYRRRSRCRVRAPRLNPWAPRDNDANRKERGHMRRVCVQRRGLLSP
jgi:hypothetical protein